jgi:tetratricopeptide (TPR) repeat protein
MIDENMWNLIGEYNRDQENPETALARANMHRGNNNFRQAILDYNHYVKFNSEQPYPFLALADCHYFLDDKVAAIENYEKAISIAQTEIPHEFLINYAGSLCGIAHYEKALTVVNNILVRDKKFVFAYILKGQILLQTDKYDRAFYYLTKALELDKQQWQGWATRIKVDYCLDDYYRAISDYKNAIAIYPDLPVTYVTTYAFALFNSGEKKEAIKEFERAKLLGDPEATAVYEKIKNY